MKTIDERATEWSENNKNLYGIDALTLMEASYHQGATDQRAIDIDKACEWWVQHFASNCILKHDYDRCMEKIDEFRKAMEQPTK